MRHNITWAMVFLKYYLAFDQYIYLNQIQKYTHYIIIYNIGRALEQASAS